MTTDTTERRLVWAVLAIVAATVLLPAFRMGVGTMGAGPTMGGTWGDHARGAGGPPGWLLVVGPGTQLLFLAVVVGAVYLASRAVVAREGPVDPAIEELRTAHARGDLSDEEYERRRERLESEP